MIIIYNHQLYCINVDPPIAELSDVSTIVYSSVGDEVILTGATEIMGNPFPAGVWRINGSNIPIVLSGRYSSETTGELFITNVAVEDFGNYVFIASNGVGDDLTSEIISLLEIGKKVSSSFQCHATLESTSCMVKLSSWFVFDKIVCNRKIVPLIPMIIMIVVTRVTRVNQNIMFIYPIYRTSIR